MKETTMQKMTLAAVTAAALGAVVLTGCADTDDHDCYPAPSYIYVVGGVYHYGSPTGTVIPRKYVDPKKGTLKKGVTVTPKGKVNVTKPSTGGGNNKGNGSVTKPGGSGYKAPAPKAPAPAPRPAPKVR